MKLLIDVGTSKDASDAVAVLIKNKLGRDLQSYINRVVKSDQNVGKHSIIRLTDDEHNSGYPETYKEGWQGYTWVTFTQLFFNSDYYLKRSSLKLNEEYTAVISEDKKTITVGCQKFPSSVVLELAEMLK